MIRDSGEVRHHPVDRQGGSSRGLSALGGIATPTTALKGCKTRPARQASDNQILKLLDKSPPPGFARCPGLDKEKGPSMPFQSRRITLSSDSKC
jgi:hypothetical protein